MARTHVALFENHRKKNEDLNASFKEPLLCPFIKDENEYKVFKKMICKCIILLVAYFRIKPYSYIPDVPKFCSTYSY